MPRINEYPQKVVQELAMKVILISSKLCCLHFSPRSHCKNLALKLLNHSIKIFSLLGLYPKSGCIIGPPYSQTFHKLIHAIACSLDSNGLAITVNRTFLNKIASSYVSDKRERDTIRQCEHVKIYLYLDGLRGCGPVAAVVAPHRGPLCIAHLGVGSAAPPPRAR